jgi:hypothetical protein
LIKTNGKTFHGISVFGLGVFTHDNSFNKFTGKNGRWAYAGQHKDGYACGLGVTAMYGGHKEYAEYGPDGQYDGRNLRRLAFGRTIYSVYERGGWEFWKPKDSASVSATGRRCYYNDVACKKDDPRLLALIAQVAPVEVRLEAS